MTKPYEAEGQSFGSVGAIIGLIVGVGIAVLVLIFVGSLAGTTYELSEHNLDNIGDNAVAENTFTGNATHAQSLAHGWIQTGTLKVGNSTSWGIGNTLNLSKMTIDYDAGTILLNPSSGYANGTTLYANYTWGASDVREYAKDGIVSGFSALKQTGDYLPIVCLAVIIAIVLGLVMGFTAFGNRGGEGGAL